jgi:LPS O-antigen subunit length determinant protein (WzzB/FepE family)
MPDIIQLIASWKKQIFSVVLISMIVATAAVFIITPKYLASATALPANPVTADKSIVFNNNIRDLYNSIGTPTELDRVIGTAQSDTIYLSIARKFDLVSFYNIKGNTDFALMKAAKALKHDTKVTKSEFGELMIRVWCRDRLLAPQLANAIMDELALIHQEILNRNNQLVLQNIKAAILSFQEAKDTLAKVEVIEQLKNYRKLELEYSLMISTKPPALLPVEKARISSSPDKPRKALILIATALASFIFALWLALLLDKRKSSGQ